MATKGIYIYGIIPNFYSAEMFRSLVNTGIYTISYQNISAIVSERERLLREMERIEGVAPYPSEANFILFRVKDPDRLYRKLLKKGVLVRNMNDGMRGCLRVTVGTPAENTAFLKALSQSLK